MLEYNTFGDPESELRWTSYSLRKISEVLNNNKNIKVNHNTIARILNELGYSRKKNKKYNQIGKPSEFRDQQFLYIYALIDEFKELNIPIISIDSKNKIIIGNYSNVGTIYTKGEPIKTNDHDFIQSTDIRLNPFGIYCLNNNTGFINLNSSHDTSEFAANSIIYWWLNIGKYQFPEAKKILLLSDCGGSNRARGPMWKEQIFMISLMTGLEVVVSHYPNGCSKYNPIEHKLFSFISINWQGIPLINTETCASLITGTTTISGLSISCTIDSNIYNLKNRIFSDDEFNEIPIEYFEEWLPMWNYSINAN